MIDVCLCTHNPQPELLKKVLASILNQTVSGKKFCLLIVDNASSPPIDESLIDQFKCHGVNARIVRESILGIAHARLRAIQETRNEWVLFVDDDNELTPEYIAEGIKFASIYKDVGCFGGKLLLAQGLHPPKWVQPFLSRLAIKDIGEEVLWGKSASWELWEPPTAGAFIKRPVLELFRQRAEEDQSIFKLGRVGKNNLTSCEDSFIMRSAFLLDLTIAYNPKMVLYHHLDEKRFKFKYLMCLMFAYGISHVRLEYLLKSKEATMPDVYRLIGKFMKLIFKSFRGGVNQSFAFGIGIVAYHLGVRSEYLRQQQQ